MFMRYRESSKGQKERDRERERREKNTISEKATLAVLFYERLIELKITQ